MAEENQGGGVMAEATEKTCRKRGEGRPFKPGHDSRRNMNGRPKSSKSVSDTLRRYLDRSVDEVRDELAKLGHTAPDGLDMTLGDYLALKLVAGACEGRIESWKEIGDRVCPRPNRSEIRIETGALMPSISVAIGKILQAPPGACSLENLPSGLDLKDVAAMPVFRPRDDDTAIAGDG